MQQAYKTGAVQLQRLFWAQGPGSGSLQWRSLGRFNTNTSCAPANRLLPGKPAFSLSKSSTLSGQSTADCSLRQTKWLPHRAAAQPALWSQAQGLGTGCMATGLRGKPPSCPGEPWPPHGAWMWSRKERSHLMVMAPGCSRNLSLAVALCSPCTAMTAEGRVLGEVQGGALDTRIDSACAVGKESKSWDTRKGFWSLVLSQRALLAFTPLGPCLYSAKMAPPRGQWTASSQCVALLDSVGDKAVEVPPSWGTFLYIYI